MDKIEELHSCPESEGKIVMIEADVLGNPSCGYCHKRVNYEEEYRKKSYYKCGHNRGIVIMDGGPMSISRYLTWKETVGFEGNKSQCWNCYNKKELKKNE